MQHKWPLAVTGVGILLLAASACSAPDAGERFKGGYMPPTIAPASTEPPAPAPGDPVITVPPPASYTWEVTETASSAFGASTRRAIIGLIRQLAKCDSVQKWHFALS
jgi:hypothetical protein